MFTPRTRSYVIAALTTGTVAGIGGELRARAVGKRIRGQSKSRSRTRSPCRPVAEEQSEHSTADEGIEDQSGRIVCLVTYGCTQIRLSPCRPVAEELESHSLLCRGTPCSLFLLAHFNC